jgi:hypothetical protein
LIVGNLLIFMDKSVFSRVHDSYWVINSLRVLPKQLRADAEKRIKYVREEVWRAFRGKPKPPFLGHRRRVERLVKGAASGYHP